MHEPGKSDSRVLPKKVSNKAQRWAAERLEGRRLAKRNSPQATTLRTQGRARVHAALGRVRQVAEQKKGARFTALLHHIYAIDTLRAAFYSLKRDAAPGVDGETWDDYGEALEAHLADLSDRVRCQRSLGPAQWRSCKPPAGGQVMCPVTASKVAHGIRVSVSDDSPPV